MPPDENEEVCTMQRGQRRSPQPSRPGQPQRAPQRRPATYRRKRRRSKRPMIFATIAAIVVVLVVIISVSAHNAREDARLTAQIKANADAVTPFSDQVESARSESPAVKFGELLDVTETNLTDKTICVVKVKISPSYSIRTISTSSI